MIVATQINTNLTKGRPWSVDRVMGRKERGLGAPISSAVFWARVRARNIKIKQAQQRREVEGLAKQFLESLDGR